MGISLLSLRESCPKQPPINVYIYIYIIVDNHIYIYIYGKRDSCGGLANVAFARRGKRTANDQHAEVCSDLKLFISIRAFRAYPLIEIRQISPCRAIRGNSISVKSTLTPS